jgi:hypothetical protein
VTPTVITPTLVASVVGVCRQVVDVLPGGVLNAQALVSLAAIALAAAAPGTPPIYGGLDGLNLDLSLNNGPALSVAFVGNVLSPAQVVAQVAKAFTSAGITAFTVESIGTTQWRIRSYGENEFQTIEVLPTSAPAVLAAFGFGPNRVYAGESYYAQRQTAVATTSFPDPNNNIAQLVIDPSTVRAFFFLGGTGSSLQELLQTESFLRNGLATPAVATGSVDLTTLVYGPGGTVDGETVIVTVNGAGTPLTVTFAAPASPADILSQIAAVTGTVLTPTENGSNELVLTTLLNGPTASILIGAGTANVGLGLTPGTTVGVTAAAAIDAGNGTQQTPLIQCPGQNFTAAPTSAQVIGTVPIPGGGVPDGETLELDDGTGVQTWTFVGATSPALVLTQLNSLFGATGGGELVAALSVGALALTNTKLGVESIVQVVGGTAMATLGLTAGITRGAPYAPLPGDYIFIDGVLLGVITKVAPGGNANQLKLDRQVPIQANLGGSFYITAKGLSATAPSSGVTRPTPNLTVDASANLLIKPEIIHDYQGNVASVKCQIYVAYRALRLDVTAKAKSPALLNFSDTTTLESVLAPLTVDNPLGLGLYFALLNAPNTNVTGLGVDEQNSGYPDGTIAAYTRAATFLEGYEVYAIAPLTHDPSVFQVFGTHVTVMSSPENKGERIVLINPSVPTSKIDTLVASGVNGNSTPSPNVFDTGVANLGALLLAQGVTPGPLVVSDGVYLDIGNGSKYSISDITDSVVTVQTSGFQPGENDDAYYATVALPEPLIAEAFAVRIRGAALVLPDGTPDKDNIALTVQQQAQGYLNRRIWSTFPDQCAATLSGVEQVIDGFYLNAAIAGMVSQQPPQQSFTNFPMTGFTRVIGSNDTFSERQLNVVAAGGNYIIVQDAPATPLISRMALTTDMTSIETRTDSITKVVDFVAKFMRRGLKNFIGRFNITQGFLDSLGHVIQGLLGFLSESGIIIGANLNNLIQDTSAPDTVLVDITLDVPFPCNYIRLTLVI